MRAASATSAGVGSPGCFSYSGRPATAAATASIASTGGSDTTSARRPPITSASAPMTPGPNLIRTGSWAWKDSITARAYRAAWYGDLPIWHEARALTLL